MAFLMSTGPSGSRQLLEGCTGLTLMVGHLVQGLRQRRLTTFSAAINVFTFEADYLGRYPEIQLN